MCIMKSAFIFVLFFVFSSSIIDSHADMVLKHTNEVNSTEILSHVQKGDKIVNFSNKIIKGNINLNQSLNGGTKSVNSIIDISNAFIMGAINFDDICFRKPVFFNNTIFADDVSFHNSSFLGGAYFNNSHFNKLAHFTEARFQKNAYFQGSNFIEADFSGCNFSNNANFNLINILKSCDFDSAEFAGMADFRNANFKGEAKFIRTIFKDTAHFEDVIYNVLNYEGPHFLGEAYFKRIDNNKSSNQANQRFSFRNARCYGYTDFSYANLANSEIKTSVFSKKVDFIGTNFTGQNAYFSGTQFSGQVDLSKTHFYAGKAVFQDTEFDDMADFSYANFIKSSNFNGANFTNKVLFEASNFTGKATFQSAQFHKEGNFKNSNFGKEIDLSNSHFFKDGIFRDSKFDGLVNLNHVRFDGDVDLGKSVFGDKAQLHLDETKYGKIYLRWEQIKGGLFKDSLLFYNEEAFLSLIQNYKSLGWIGDANECYLEYRKHARQSLPGILLIPDVFLWAFYGYGVKPEWTIFWSVVLVFAFGLFYWRNEGSKIESAIIFSGTVFLSGTGKLLITEPTYNPKYKIKFASFVFKLERLIGGFFIFLFFISVTKTVTV
jgi:uncharacterized protein YjbI with pentapeptide repeats